jgi:hypothetical protein
LTAWTSFGVHRLGLKAPSIGLQDGGGHHFVMTRYGRMGCGV